MPVPRSSLAAGALALYLVACGSSKPTSPAGAGASHSSVAGANSGGGLGSGSGGNGGQGPNGNSGAGGLSTAGAAALAAPLAPTHLTVEDRARPLNVEGAPRFGWFVQDPSDNDTQTAYQLQVTRERDAMLVWDSDKVASSEQSYVAYGGPKLEAGASYSWTVRTWDSTDQPSPWAEAARFDIALTDQDFAASWLRRQTTEADDYTLARGEIAIAASPVVRARAYVSASHQYELYLNGKLADRGLAFSYPGETYYQTADVTELVTAGAPLAVGVLYHWYGSGQGRPAAKSGLLVRVVVDHQDGTSETLMSDASWRVRRASQWQTGAPKRSGDSGDYVERIDATLAPSGWAEPGYDDSGGGWAAPQVLGKHPADVFTHLRGQLSHLAYENVPAVSVKTLPDGAVVADFGKVVPARPLVKFAAGKAGRSLTLHCGYRLTGDGHVDTATSANQSTDVSFTYVQRDGAQELRPFTYFACRYLQIAAPGPGETLANDAIQAIVQHTDAPAEDAAELETSDPTLDAVFQLVQRSSLYGAQEQFVDTPTREKGQFLGDAVNHSFATMAGWRERSLTQKALREFMASQKRHWQDGRLNAVYPNGDGARDIPDFTLMFVTWVWRYYLETGDRGLLEEAYPVIKNVADYAHSYLNAGTGLITDLAGGSGDYLHGIVDWPPSSRFGYDTSTAARTTVNALVVAAERIVADAGELLGKPANEVATYRDRSASLIQAINGKLRRADGVYSDGLSAGGQASQHASQHASAYAITFGVAPEADYPKLAEHLSGLGMQQGPMTAHWLLQALGSAQQPAQALGLLTDKSGLGWANVLEQGGTFTWESWTARSDAISESHGWGAQALVDILEIALGVRIQTPGAASVLIAPPSSGLAHAKGKLTTQRGPVAVDWTRSDDAGLTLDLDLPANMRAQVVLPDAVHEVGSGHSHFVVAP